MSKFKASIVALILCTPMTNTYADKLLTDNFDTESQSGWAFFSDQVMGGISEGAVEYMSRDGETYAHMTGSVSTANNGGFIQIRRGLAKGSVSSATGVYIKARGNLQKYFIHLRTSGTVLPWQYYQAGFEVSGDWREVRLPLSDFKRSGSWLRQSLTANSIRSIGILAYGRDHQADIDIAEIGFYD